MSLQSVITDAVADLTAHGFDSVERVEHWLAQIRIAAEQEMTGSDEVERQLARALEAIYTREVDKGGILRHHPTVDRFTIEQLKPHLRQELNQRLIANRQRIKLDKAQAMMKTEQRFANWATSMPSGGSGDVDKVAVKKDIRKPLQQLPYYERRVAIDQSAKMVSSLNEIIAVDGGAIAVIWHSNWREKGYQFRPDHKKRDLKIYCIKDSWAKAAGLITKCDGYTSDQTTFAEEPYCRCFGEYLYNLRDIPDRFMTQKGREELARVRIGRS